MRYSLMCKSFAGSEVLDYEKVPVNPENNQYTFSQYPCSASITTQLLPHGQRLDITLSFHEDTTYPMNFSFSMETEQWKKDNYVLMPGAVYNGNRFTSVPLQYPPYYQPAENCSYADAEVITSIPHLDFEKTQSQISLLSGDMASPLCGFYDFNGQSGSVLLGEHQCGSYYTGFTVDENQTDREAFFVLSAPGVREATQYFFGDQNDGQGFRPDNLAPSQDTGALFKQGQSLTLTVCVFQWQQISLQDFFKLVNGAKTTLENPNIFYNVPFYKAYTSIKEKYQQENFTKEGYYSVGTDWNIPQQCWQAGWIGGGINCYPFLLEDSSEARQRALSTLRFIFSRLQHPSGWVYGMYGDGKFYGDGGNSNPDTILLVRKNADLLYFVVKQLFWLSDNGHSTLELEQPVKAFCDAFVRLFRKYGQLGQFIDMAAEEMVIGNSAGACMAVGALALASEYFQCTEYRDVAVQLGEYYYINYVKKGMLNGCPGEICQAPDSEAAFAMLESYLQLFETTKESIWLAYAEETCEIAMTWVMSYDFVFPAHSTAARRSVHSSGTVFANAQNKHSAPGICTLSGNSLLKLYRFTGSVNYLHHLYAIAHSLPQYVSLAENPEFTLEKKYLPSGYMNERVQTSDWEGKETVGEFLYGSNWPEVSMLLTFVEVPGVYVDFTSHILQVFDHVECYVTAWNSDSVLLEMYNPTAYATTVTLLADERTNTMHVMRNYFEKMKTVPLSAGQRIQFELKK
ncbi:MULTISPECIES: hypothetical protein [Paenibacillus]|uniref:Uncharacterized protein n=1 Tax=Paenibacillus albilobatus TaxID=2716884 RepID=A0A919XBI6_9BACL|nr:MULTISPECIES: hypothetical protein [Paenibacillus]GIO29616.1 hypothetical protein J2TS6_07570 [Paenibacillus albilobatus]